MTITTNMDNGTLTIALEGRLDTMTAPQLEAELGKQLAECKQLVLDLDKLDYISSAGLRVVLGAQKKMTGRGELKITNASEAIMEVFDMTGFTDMLNIEGK